jgi:hypothetical protein
MVRHVLISEHAKNRWRSRASTYGDEHEAQITAAVLASRLVRPKDPVPFVRRPHTAYYHHAATNTYFVCQPLDHATVKVVSVLIGR